MTSPRERTERSVRARLRHSGAVPFGRFRVFFFFYTSSFISQQLRLVDWRNQAIKLIIFVVKHSFDPFMSNNAQTSHKAEFCAVAMVNR